MFRKNKEFLEQTQPVVMALVLDRQTQRETIIVGSKRDVHRFMEGQTTHEELFVRERNLGQLIFDWKGEDAQIWNECLIYELKNALKNRLYREKGERKAMIFLQEKLASNNAVSVFWARNCLNAYENCKKKAPSQRYADLFETKMMAHTRLSKNTILPFGQDYDVEDVIERVQTIMCASGYRQNVAVQIFYPWRRCKEEFVLIEDSILAGILFYLNRLLEWNVCFRTCAVCGKNFLATSSHHSLCSDACRKEQNRLNKQAFDMRAQQSICERDYSGSTRRMRDLIKRKSKTASPEVCALAQSFYDRFRGEAKKRKKNIKKKHEEIAFRDWLFEQERQLEDILGGTK